MVEFFISSPFYTFDTSVLFKFDCLVYIVVYTIAPFMALLSWTVSAYLKNIKARSLNLKENMEKSTKSECFLQETVFLRMYIRICILIQLTRILCKVYIRPYNEVTDVCFHYLESQYTVLIYAQIFFHGECYTYLTELCNSDHNSVGHMCRCSIIGSSPWCPDGSARSIVEIHALNAICLYRDG